MAGQWILSDAHAHMGSPAERQEREQNGIFSLLCGGTPGEAEALWESFEKSKGKSCLKPACGIHPWYADRYELSDMERWLLLCPVIGEIGMDSVWCRVPLDVQEERMRQQLHLACRLQKPVVLHTKGQEEKIARIIDEYPNRYLVHWYSCESFLEEYVSRGCYFSVGPDVWWNPSVRKVAERVPLERLLIETDGLEAVRWAWEEGERYREVQGGGQPLKSGPSAGGSGGRVTRSLEHTLQTIAGIRGISLEEAGRQFAGNLKKGFLLGV
ncbi:MAG: TatD family hydrolase [Hungatella sp.]|nr:TatD family hydrolase [Hungatella sp.]